MTDRRLLTAPEVAERLHLTTDFKRLHLTTDFIYALTRRGEIPHLRFGRTYRYRGEAIETWLQEQEQNNTRSAHDLDGPATSPTPTARRL